MGFRSPGKGRREGKEGHAWLGVSLRSLIGESEEGVCGGAVVERTKVRCGGMAAWKNRGVEGGGGGTEGKGRKRTHGRLFLRSP